MITEVISNMKKLSANGRSGEATDKVLLVSRLEKQYPADVDVISAIFVLNKNYVKLNLGEV